VHIAFCVGKGEPVEWMVARDLLSTGMWRRSGVGDVTVGPSVGSATGASGSVMNIEISSPNGHAHFEAAVKEISNFLRRTYQVVPAGEESVHLDAELTNLLRSASLVHGAPSCGDRGGDRGVTFVNGTADGGAVVGHARGVRGGEAPVCPGVSHPGGAVRHARRRRWR
jgi:hypothetical protein